MVYNLRFFLFKMQFFFHNSNVFGSCIIHILYTGCARIKKNNSGAKRIMSGRSTEVEEMGKSDSAICPVFEAGTV